MKFRKLIFVILVINIIACIGILSRIHYLSVKEKQIKAKIESTIRGSGLEDLMWERFILVVILLFVMVPTSGGILIYIGRKRR